MVVVAVAAAVGLMVNVSVATIQAGPARADASTGPAGLFVPATGRLVDTRTTTALAGGVSRLVQATGQAGIPSTNVAAVAVTITAVSPSTNGYLWAGADGAAGGSTSMLSYGPASGVDGTVSNSAVVAVSPTTGKIQVQSSSTVHVLVDVQGYYTSGSSTTAGGFVPTFPTRLVDTRNGTGLPLAKIAAGATANVQITGNAGVPAGASAVFVNVTVLDYSATSKGFIRTYATGGTVPVTSLNYQPDAATAIGNAVPLSAGGSMAITLSTSNTSPVDVLVDVQGYYSASAPNASFTPAAARVFDGRPTSTTVPANGTSDIQVAGTAGVPAVSAGLTAAALNVQVVSGTAEGYAVAYASGDPAPGTYSTVSFEAAEIRGNLAMVKIGDNGKITIRNASSTPITMVIDLQGWYIGVRKNPLEVGPRFNATRLDFPIPDRVQASVDVGTGNLSVTSTELTVPGIDKDIQLGMTFNSLLLGTSSPLPKGAGGFGWAHRFGQDTELQANTDGSVVYLAPGGTQGKYVPSSSSAYRSPAGFKNTLTKTSTGWELKDKKSNAISYFNTTGALSKITNGDGQSTTLSYNGSGYLTSVTGTQDAASKTITVTPNAQGLTTGMSQPSATAGSRSVSYTYTGGQLATITDAKARVTTFGYASPGGDLISIENTGGNTTTFSYDTNHRVTAVSRGNGAQAPSVTRFAYLSDTQTAVAAPNTDQSQPVTSVPRTTYTLNDTERVTASLDPLNRNTETEYTEFADVKSRQTPTGTTTGTYDPSVNGGESLTGLSSPTGASMSMTYGTGPDDKYLPTGVTDTQGTASTYSYSGSGNPLTSANSGTAASASVTYNTDGTLKTSKDPLGNVTSYPLDATAHRTTGITPPSGSGLGASALTYDGYGRVATVTDGRGAVATYSYNDLDQVTGISYSGAGLPATTAIAYTYNNVGALKTRTDASGTTTWTYNTRGLTLSRTNTAGGGTLTYGYDRTGNVTSFTNARGTTTYGYDAANQLTSRTGTDGSDYYAYNGDGKRTDTWWRANPAHTTFAAHTFTKYDAAGRIVKTWTSRASNDATRAFDTEYCYSPYTGASCPAMSNLASPNDTSLIQWSTNMLTTDRSIYGYDKASRLTSVTNYNGHDYTYTYDANGNRKTRKVDTTTTATLTFNAGNQITTTGYGYDQAGNQVTDPTNGTIRYNTAGQMISAKGATTTQNTYAGAGHNELTNQALPGGLTMTYTYSADSPEGVPALDSITRNTDTTYIENDPTTGRPQALNLSTGENTYLATDGQGSVTALISSTTGNPVAATYTYDPYGLVTATTGTGLAATSNPYRQAAGIQDPLTGWNRHGTRYHDTTTGRWSTTDPITRLNDPNQANQYAYAASNPINYADPTGKYVWTDIIGTAVALASGTACSIGTAMAGTILCGAAASAFGLGVTYSLNFIIYGDEVG